MSDLSLGLTFGLAVAGGIGGFLLNGIGNLGRGLVAIGARDSKLAGKASGGYLSSALIGAFAGAVLGFGVGKGIDYMNQPSCKQKDGISITMNDANGKRTCMSFGPNGVIVVPN